MLDYPVIAYFYSPHEHRRVQQDFTITVTTASGTFQITVPTGYDQFNGASIPKFLWSSIGHPYMKAYEAPALVHDYLYDTPAARATGFKTRAEIDALFFHSLVAYGVPKPRARLMHWAVDKFGKSYFTPSGGAPTRHQPGLYGTTAEEARGRAAMKVLRHDAEKKRGVTTSATRGVAAAAGASIAVLRSGLAADDLEIHAVLGEDPTCSDTTARDELDTGVCEVPLDE
jgi:hypothetical protein